MTDQALIIDGITKRYDKFAALEGVSLSVAPGERLALLGHNGAGKTTLIKLILGLMRSDEGSIKVTARRRPVKTFARFRHTCRKMSPSTNR